MEQYFIEFAPIIIVVLAFIFKNKIFATPTELQAMKAEILREIKEEYATKEILKFVQDDMGIIKSELKDLNAFLRTEYKR